MNDRLFRSNWQRWGNDRPVATGGCSGSFTLPAEHGVHNNAPRLGDFKKFMEGIVAFSRTRRYARSTQVIIWIG